MAKNIWQLRGSELKTFAPEFLEAVGGSPLVAQLLYNRGIQTATEAKAFLNLQDYQPTPGWELPGMDVAVERVLQAIDNRESILIFGDFDVDGITGTSVLYQTLKFLNANVSYYIPDRATEGHGLNVAALCRLVSTRQTKLVITTDTGITNFAEVSLLNGLGVDTIVTDHHELPENLPQSLANVNPKLLEDQNHPLALLAGVGVAYKLCELVLEAKGAPPEFTESLLDLVAIGTVADLASLHRENRYLVYRGIQVLNKRQRLGVNEILSQAGVKPEAILASDTVGFTIGPRLNALGRLDNASEAVELLTTHDAERARVIAAHLEHLNRRRQELCDQTMFEAEKHLLTAGGLDGRKAIILGSPDWNPGIIGIVASRLIEKYHVPVFLMVIDESKGEARCSARSIPGFHLHEALTPLSNYFLHFGGHSGAGGFALKLEKLEGFKQELYQLTDAQITEEQMLPVVEVDARLHWSQVNPYLVEMISAMAPFGKDNPAPKFLLEDGTIAAQRSLGVDGRHLKLILTGEDPKQPIEALMWNAGQQTKLNPMLKYNFVAVPELNTYNGVTKVQLIVDDFKEAKPAAVTVAASAPANVVPLPVSEVQEVVSESKNLGPNWIDHRSRESLETFMGQLMLPLQDREQVIFYNEGKKPEIPFLDEGILSHRHGLRPAETLILWDLPPDMGSFQQVLRQVDPKVIHLVGGKYQTVTLFPPVRDYLKVIYQTLSRSAAQQGEKSVSVHFDQWAARFAATRTVMTQGLILLGKLGLISIAVQEEEISNQVLVSIEPNPPAGAEQNISRTIEYLAFHQALKEMGRFRDWMLRTPIDQLKSSAIVDTYHHEETQENGKQPNRPELTQPVHG